MRWPPAGPSTLRLRDTTTEPWRVVRWDVDAGWREVADAHGAHGNVPWHDTWWTLRCLEHGAFATKRWTWGPDGWPQEPDAFNAGTWFEPVRWVVPSTAESWAAFFGQLDGDATALLIRGVPPRVAAVDSPWAPRRACRRALEHGWWAPHPRGRDVVLFDFDKLEPPAGWPGRERWPTVAEGERCIRWAVARSLPAAFWQAACAYRWSASTGVPGYKRGPVGWSRPSFHAAFVLDRLVCDASLAAWADEAAGKVRGVDRALFNPIQAHYLAAPVFEGAPSPWTRPRWGLLDGTPKVATPAELVDGWTWQARTDEEGRRRAQADADRHKERVRATLGRGLDADAHEREERGRAAYKAALLDGIAEDIANAPTGARHLTLRAKVRKLEGLVAGAVLNRAEAEELAKSAAPKGEGRNLKYLWRWAPRRATTTTLDELRSKGGKP